MTDAEIIKALECCVNTELDCEKDCPIYDYCEENSSNMVKAVLDLINRQKAEIEKLRKRVNFVEQANVQLREELKETTEKFNCQQYVYVDLSNIIKEKIAEIEKLQTEKEKLRCVIGDLSNNTEQAKAEAIKEFAERLKPKLSYYDEEVVDNLLKEMVGEG